MKLYIICVVLLSVFFHVQSHNLQMVYDKADGLIASLRTQLDELKQRYLQVTALPQKATHQEEVPGLKPFPVYCDTRLAGSGWTVIQRRLDGSENFYRSWEEYSQGFGNLSGEFFLGLEKLHFLTTAEPYELYVHIEDFYDDSRYAHYDNFVIGNASDSYALETLGKYSGNAGDSLAYHKGMPFSTFDHDVLGHGCARRYVAAWWYDQCQRSNLNGQYLDGGRFEAKLSGRGITWMSWRGYDYGYKFAQMMIRPKCFNNLQRQRQSN
ncbi:fibrinogen C domain-containing protein 1 isoform X2 [Drosophila serrata]|uniref:fibrinogen C domain-containing protein 1 isoform X2 n=1 Tax=Drosophila serrata TaxID=7274 RepID=UPI000A1D0115|nr:fibrinogen C domain-containing protein 1 isoform X2 [Drosophila serrata]